MPRLKIKLENFIQKIVDAAKSFMTEISEWWNSFTIRFSLDPVQSYIDQAIESPMIMAVSALWIVAIFYIVYKGLKSKSNRKKSLNMLKAALEEEDWDSDTTDITKGAKPLFPEKKKVKTPATSKAQKATAQTDDMADLFEDAVDWMDESSATGATESHDSVADEATSQPTETGFSDIDLDDDVVGMGEEFSIEEKAEAEPVEETPAPPPKKKRKLLVLSLNNLATEQPAEDKPKETTPEPEPATQEEEKPEPAALDETAEKKIEEETPPTPEEETPKETSFDDLQREMEETLGKFSDTEDSAVAEEAEDKSEEPEPPSDEPVTEEPTQEEVALESDEPATEEPALEEPPLEEPVQEKAVHEEAVEEEITLELHEPEPSIEEPAQEEPAPQLEEPEQILTPDPDETSLSDLIEEAMSITTAKSPEPIELEEEISEPEAVSPEEPEAVSPDEVEAVSPEEPEAVSSDEEILIGQVEQEEESHLPERELGEVEKLLSLTTTSEIKDIGPDTSEDESSDHLFISDKSRRIVNRLKEFQENLEHRFNTLTLETLIKKKSAFSESLNENVLTEEESLLQTEGSPDDDSISLETLESFMFTNKRP